MAKGISLKHSQLWQDIHDTTPLAETQSNIEQMGFDCLITTLLTYAWEYILWKSHYINFVDPKYWSLGGSICQSLGNQEV